jgi:hypothetical protein
MKYEELFTSTFGSNLDGAFDVIATLYCRENDKQQNPSNVVSHEVTFLTTQISSLLRRFMQTCVISDLIFQTPYIHHKTDVSKVVRPTSWMWQERRLRRGKSDVLDVARGTS